MWRTSDDHSHDSTSYDAPLDRAALFVEFAPLINRLIRQYGQTPEMRQDLVGELYCLFDSFIENYDPDRGIPLRFYLVRQLTASAFTFARKRWRQSEREVSLTEANAFRLPVVDPTPDWDRMLLAGDVAAVLPHLIERLPPRQRQVVVRRYYEDCSFEEIACTLGVKTASARSLLRHGLNRLREQMSVERMADCRP
jgi:RNA polymerase sigma-70 factor (ECF subfamily)